MNYLQAHPAVGWRDARGDLSARTLPPVSLSVKATTPTGLSASWARRGMRPSARTIENSRWREDAFGDLEVSSEESAPSRRSPFDLCMLGCRDGTALMVMAGQSPWLSEDRGLAGE